MPDLVLQARDLVKAYGRDSASVRALDGITVDIRRGEFISIVGRSGSGKTTFLDCLGLLLRPTSGTILFEGLDTATLSEDNRAELRGRRIGFVFQDFNLIPTLTAVENVLLPLRYTSKVNNSKRRALGALDEVGLASRAHHRPGQMSGGEQQRVALARALINEPAVILADEPTGEVDSETRALILNLIRDINREHGVTFLIATHDMELAAETDRTIRIRDGCIVEDGTGRPTPNGILIDSIR